jgi:hypothetical protein
MTVTRQFLYVWSALVVISSTLLGADDKLPSPAEQAKAVEAAKQRMMQQFDLNHDGVLSEGESGAEEALRQQGFRSWPAGEVETTLFWAIRPRSTAN